MLLSHPCLLNCTGSAYIQRRTAASSGTCWDKHLPQEEKIGLSGDPGLLQFESKTARRIVPLPPKLPLCVEIEQGVMFPPRVSLHCAVTVMESQFLLLQSCDSHCRADGQVSDAAGKGQKEKAPS